MSTNKKSVEINSDRRSFLGTAAVTIAAAQLGMFSSTSAEASEATPAGSATTQLGANTSFGSLKQIDAGLLNVGFAEVGPANGTVVVLTRLAL